MSYLQPGTIFANDFRIVRHLSAGGMGSVFVVEQLSTGKERALKVMHRELSDDSSHRTRFESEARISASIESDHVVEVLAAGVESESGIPWLVMELLRGETLEAHVLRAGPMGIAAVRECARQLRHVLEQAHLMGLVHRDLKPENLFLASAKRQDVPFTLKVLDFGIAKWAQEAKSTLKNSQMIGSPLWMAPEQLHTGALISSATDVWALGLIFFFLLTGKHYWATANATSPSITGLLLEVAGNPMPPASQRAKQFAPNIELPDGFDAWFEQTTNREMAHRFEHAGACLDAFVALLADRTSVLPATPSIVPRGDAVAFDTIAISGSEDPEMLLRIARVYELRDTDRPRAAQAYRRVLELAPTSIEAYEALSMLLEGMGDWAELDGLLVREAEALPLRGEALGRIWLRIATIRKERRNDPEGHLKALQRAFEADPRDRGTTIRLVEAISDRGAVDSLLADARAAGQDIAFLETLAGDVATERGELDVAEAAYARALAAETGGREGDDGRGDPILRAKFAQVGAQSGVVGPDEVRARWARVLEVDLRHTAAWEGVVAAAEKMGDREDLALVVDAALTVLGDAAPEAIRARESVAPKGKGAAIDIDASRLAALAEHSLDGGPLASLLAESPARTPLKGFGLTLKELVDPMMSSRALLQRAMPIYRQLSAAGAALDLPSTPQVYFKEEGAAGFVRLWSDPPAIVIHADIEKWTPDEIVFAAHELLTGSRPELAPYLAFFQLPLPPQKLEEPVRRFLHAAERASARVALLAARTLRAARVPLAARKHAQLAAENVEADLALFVASGAAARALAAARAAA